MSTEATCRMPHTSIAGDNSLHLAVLVGHQEVGKMLLDGEVDTSAID